MFLMTLLSSLCLLAGSAIANPSVEIIRQNHLETPEGKAAFLMDRLAPYTEKAGQLNEEIKTLSQEIQTLSAQDDQQTILALTKKVAENMAALSAMLPMLNAALSIDEDFLQIDAILDQTTPLSPEQEQAVDRIASLCNAVEKFS